MRVGIFAKTFPRPTLEASLDAAVSHGVHALQFNLALVGGPSLPSAVPAALTERVAAAFAERELRMVAVSGTYNMAHPDPEVRAGGRARLAAVIEAAPGLGTNVVTLCTGTRSRGDMWTAHPDNATPAAWRDMLESVGAALEVAERCGVVLGVEPEHANVVSDAAAARRLLDELPSSALRIVMDGANLVDPAALDDQRRVLVDAFEQLGADIVLAHAKDVRADGTIVAAGRGELAYDDYVRLLRQAAYDGPLILHGLSEDDVPGAVAFLHAQLERDAASAT
jgi:sugar phosphate isomerase/epimerase